MGIMQSTTTLEVIKIDEHLLHQRLVTPQPKFEGAPDHHFGL